MVGLPVERQPGNELDIPIVLHDLNRELSDLGAEKQREQPEVANEGARSPSTLSSRQATLPLGTLISEAVPLLRQRCRTTISSLHKADRIMNEARDGQSDLQVQFLQELEDENASIRENAVEVCKDRWVIHGVMPYGGEVPMAVFDTYDEAKQALDKAVGAADHPKVTESEPL
jgi:hypothetical protein